MNLVPADQRRREICSHQNLSDTCSQDLLKGKRKIMHFLLQNCPKLMIFSDRISKHSAEAWFEVPYFPKLQRITLLPLRIARRIVLLHNPMSVVMQCSVRPGAD